MAFFATDAFLRINGNHITGDDQAIYQHMIHLFETGKFDREALEKWLREIVETV